jgi:hypothetical protein
MWTNIVLSLAMLLENSDFNGSLQIYFLGFPLVFDLFLKQIGCCVDHYKQRWKKELTLEIS